MFAVYNDGKLSTRGPVENLYNVKKINKVHETNNDNKDPNQEKFTIPDYNHNTNITKEATEAYKKSANIDTRDAIYHVYQIMNKEVIYVNTNDTIEDTYAILDEKNIRQLPIVDNNGKIQGLVTQKHILDLIFSDLENINHSMKKNLSSLDLPDVITADPIADIRRVAKVMVDFNLNAMPIVNQDDILVGIVSRTDILKTVASVPPMQLWA